MTPAKLFLKWEGGRGGGDEGELSQAKKIPKYIRFLRPFLFQKYSKQEMFLNALKTRPVYFNPQNII